VFLGRRSVAGIRPGTVMAVDGVLGEHLGRLAVLNPSFTLLASRSTKSDTEEPSR
jgi:hypothetical protein